MHLRLGRITFDFKHQSSIIIRQSKINQMDTFQIKKQEDSLVIWGEGR